jgi:hypothetical protein
MAGLRAFLKDHLGFEYEGERHDVVDEIVVLVSISVSAMVFLLIEGFLATGVMLEGTILILLIFAAVVDLLPEAWMLIGPFQYDAPLLDKIMKIHYILTGAAYLMLGAALVQTGWKRQFYLYSAFLVFWIFSFLLGEALVIFLHEHHRPDE